ncbi:MAG: DDE-type integrase/transposase/recombinase [Candidatus Thermoplasmatota archaeon]|nr:DDE-type integrase/transposase/recombinase [Candidatus Thermoplasmatota archaeon]
MYIYQGEPYLQKDHIQLLRQEPTYLQQRYHAVMRAVSSKNNILREKEAQNLGISMRHLQRLITQFQHEGISGLRKKSTRPQNSPNKTPKHLEDLIVHVREKTGFGSVHLAELVNISLENQGQTERVHPRTVSRILVQRGIIESEKHAKKEWKHFEWGHPNRLIQTDLTTFNGIPLLTMEDDYSRRGWALRLSNQKDTTVVCGMKKLLKIRFDNLLTDNGSQFSRKNKVIRDYCQDHINEKHIWTSIHHPQTMGKLSAFQKGLKRFLFHTLHDSRDIHQIDHHIKVYVHWYNNGKYHSTIATYPEERYSGQRDLNWYNHLVTSLKLDELLVMRS